MKNHRYLVLEALVFLCQIQRSASCAIYVREDSSKMKVFASERIAYLDELDADPEVQRVMQQSADRFRFDADTRSSPGLIKWNSEVFKEEASAGNIRFDDDDYGVMSSSGGIRMADIEMLNDTLSLKMNPIGFNLINPTTDPCAWDTKTRTLIYVDKTIFNDFKTNTELQNIIADWLDKTNGHDTTKVQWLPK